MQRSWYINGLKDAFNFKVVVYIYHYGGNIQNSIFVWKVNENSNKSKVNNMNYQIRIQLKGQLQIFYTRAMKKEFKNIVELCFEKLDKARLRYIYTSWLGDNFASENLFTKEIDKRVKIMVELGDSNIITDLRGINEGESGKYDIF